MNTFIICACIVCVFAIVGATVYKCIDMVIRHDRERRG